jgi:hypothetical protein
MPDENDEPKGQKPPSGDTPQAASAVKHGRHTEEDAEEIARLTLERDEALQKVKDREFRIAQLENENRDLKSPGKPTPKEKKAWLEGWNPILG